MQNKLSGNIWNCLIKSILFLVMIYLLAINSRLLKGQSAGLLAVGWIKIGLIARQPTYD